MPRWLLSSQNQLQKHLVCIWLRTDASIKSLPIKAVEGSFQINLIKVERPDVYLQHPSWNCRGFLKINPPLALLVCITIEQLNLPIQFPIPNRKWTEWNKPGQNSFCQSRENSVSTFDKHLQPRQMLKILFLIDMYTLSLGGMLLIPTILKKYLFF